MSNTDLLYRDNLQHEIIRALYQHADPKELVLKGGFALRAAFDSPRMSKDIDLDHNPSRSVKHLEKLVGGAIHKAISTIGLREAAVTNPKKTETVVRWKINGKDDQGAPVNITVEVSRRGLISSDHIQTKNIKINGVNVAADVLDTPALIASKIAALLSESRQASRDLYDLNLLSEQANDADLVSAAALLSDEITADPWNKIDSFTWDGYKNDVLPYLPSGEAARASEALFSELQVTVAEFITKILGMRESLPPVPQP